MLNAGVLTFREFAMREKLPLAEIQAEVLKFLRDSSGSLRSNRDDVVVFGAQAVNAWVEVLELGRFGAGCDRWG